MIHEMKLNETGLNNVKNGTKKVEIRLYDEKRKKININDFIVFHNLNNYEDTVIVKVTGIFRYDSFMDLFKNINFNICGKANSLNEKLNNLYKIYSPEEEEKYSVLAIYINRI